MTDEDPKTADVFSGPEVRARFADAGQSIAEWARENRFNVQLVYHVLSGRNQATRGQSHRIAVALGMKLSRPLGDLAKKAEQRRDCSMS